MGHRLIAMHKERNVVVVGFSRSLTWTIDWMLMSTGGDGRGLIMQCLYYLYSEDFEKRCRDWWLYTTIFKRVGHIKGENKWKSSRGLLSNELDIKGLKLAQRDKLVFPGQSVIFSSKRRLIWMSATEKGGLHFGLFSFLGKVTKQIPELNYTHDNKFIWLSLIQKNYFKPCI